MGSTYEAAAAAHRASTEIDLRAGTPDTAHAIEALDAVARDLRRVWATALARGDFDELTRLVEASHAVQRAVISLKGDAPVAVPGPGR